MSITLTFTFEIDDVLTDVTSCVLSDATGAYGVKRNDTDAVVVADSTAMTKTSTGKYEYIFTEPADGLTYTWVAEYVYLGTTYREVFTYTDSTQVVTLDEAKTHLRITGTDEDTLLNSLIDAATEYAQEYQRRKYLTTSCVDYLDAWLRVIRPAWSPLVAVTSITYVDANGTTQTLAADQYRVDTDTQPARITEAWSCTWPAIRNITNAIAVTYTAGYGTAAADVPQRIRSAILLLVGHLYNNREDTTERTLARIPVGAKALLDMDRLIKV